MKGGVFVLLLLLGLLALVHGDACPTLQLKATINRKRVLPAGRAKLTVSVRNTGTIAAPNAVVEVELPLANGVRFQSAKTQGHVKAVGTPAFTQTGATLRWAFPQLPPKKQVKLSIALWVDACAVPTASVSVGVMVFQLAGGSSVCPVTGPTPAVRVSDLFACFASPMLNLSTSLIIHVHVINPSGRHCDAQVGELGCQAQEDVLANPCAYSCAHLCAL